MGSMPCASRNALHLEKCLQPKKPLYADRGEGCTLSSTRCCGAVMSFFLLRALPPQSRKTIGCSCSFSFSIIWSVKVVQPRFLWLFACPRRTVRVVFSMSTPRSAHLVSVPSLGGVMPRSLCSSLKMFCRLGGG